MASYILPIILIVLLIFCFVKNVNAYDHFIKGAKGSVDLCINTFPYLVAIFVLVELFKLSGLSQVVATFLSPAMQFLGIPNELVEFMVIRPFSGSGSMAILSELYSTYGADSYVSKLACVIMGSGETIYYVCALYLKGIKNKKISSAILIALLISFISILLSSIVTKLFLITS